MAELISKKYAMALFEIAREKGKMEEYLKQLGEIVKIFTEEMKFFEILNNPFIERSEKKELVEKVFKRLLDSDVLNFLMLLVEKNRQSLVDEIFREYLALLDEEKNILHVTAITAVPMLEEDKVELTKKLEGLTGKTVVLQNKVEPDIIGGMIIKVKDKLIDGSIRGRLRNLKNNLLNIQLSDMGV